MRKTTLSSMKHIADKLFGITARREKQHAAPLPYPYPSKAFWIATWGGVGHLPMAGTWGTIASLPFIGLLYTYGGLHVLALFTIFSFVTGWMACQKVAIHTGEHDHKSIVIDEVFGMAMVVLAFPYLGLGTWVHWLAAFMLFRIFDMLKPPPISWVDQKMNTPLGVMFDDALAALFSIAALWLIF